MAKQKRKQKGRDAAGTAGRFPVSTDPLGSYTGRPADTQEQPVQDADDL